MSVCVFSSHINAWVQAQNGQRVLFNQGWGLATSVQGSKKGKRIESMCKIMVIMTGCGI